MRQAFEALLREFGRMPARGWGVKPVSHVVTQELYTCINGTKHLQKIVNTSTSAPWTYEELFGPLSKVASSIV